MFSVTGTSQIRDHFFYQIKKRTKSRNAENKLSGGEITPTDLDKLLDECFKDMAG